MKDVLVTEAGIPEKATFSKNFLNHFISSINDGVIVSLGNLVAFSQVTVKGNGDVSSAGAETFGMDVVMHMSEITT